MRRDIKFDADGAVLRGRLYLPDAGAPPHPTVVIAHALPAVKETHLDRVAEAFADAGLASPVFGNRSLGAGDGDPRHQIDPWRQVSDYRAAITHAITHPEVDADRIGILDFPRSPGHLTACAARRGASRKVA